LVKVINHIARGVGRGWAWWAVGHPKFDNFLLLILIYCLEFGLPFFLRCTHLLFFSCVHHCIPHALDFRFLAFGMVALALPNQKTSESIFLGGYRTLEAQFFKTIKWTHRIANTTLIHGLTALHIHHSHRFIPQNEARSQWNHAVTGRASTNHSTKRGSLLSQEVAG
jgi:hypothetical protein